MVVWKALARASVQVQARRLPVCQQQLDRCLKTLRLGTPFKPCSTTQPSGAPIMSQAKRKAQEVGTLVGGACKIGGRASKEEGDGGASKEGGRASKEEGEGGASKEGGGASKEEGEGGASKEGAGEGGGASKEGGGASKEGEGGATAVSTQAPLVRLIVGEHPLTGQRDVRPVGPLGDALREAVACFTFHNKVEVTVILTNPKTHEDRKCKYLVGTFQNAPNILVCSPMVHSLPPGEYTTPTLFGATFGFSPDLMTVVLKTLASSNTPDSKRRSSITKYFMCVFEACRHIPLTNLPYVFNVLAAAPMLDLGLAKDIREALMVQIRNMLNELVHERVHNNDFGFAASFKERLVPEEFDKARMTAAEYEFRLQLVADVEAAMQDVPK